MPYGFLSERIIGGLDHTVAGFIEKYGDKMNKKQLKLLRNTLVIAGIVIGCIIWIFMPELFTNNRLVHFGNGKYVSKYCALIALPCPLLALLPNNKSEEIHTDDPEEYQKRMRDKEMNDLKTQITDAIIIDLLIFASYVATFLCAVG